MHLLKIFRGQFFEAVEAREQERNLSLTFICPYNIARSFKIKNSRRCNPVRSILVASRAFLNFDVRIPGVFSVIFGQKIEFLAFLEIFCTFHKFCLQVTL